jgi:hypothetical protein
LNQQNTTNLNEQTENKDKELKEKEFQDFGQQEINNTPTLSTPTLLSSSYLDFSNNGTTLQNKRKVEVLGGTTTEDVTKPKKKRPIVKLSIEVPKETAIKSEQSNNSETSINSLDLNQSENYLNSSPQLTTSTLLKTPTEGSSTNWNINE